MLSDLIDVGLRVCWGGFWGGGLILVMGFEMELRVCC